MTQQQTHEPVMVGVVFDSLADLEDAAMFLRAAADRARQGAATDPVDAAAARAFGRMATRLQCASWERQFRAFASVPA